ncbi:MAG TPA: CheR family methyltransferase, partial [Myxococcota bacterium]
TLADSSTVIGSDIDDERLARAERARYGIRHLPAIDDHHRRCFVVADDTIEPIEYLRLRTRFVHHDIVRGPIAPPEAIVASFHLIMVRNVLLYFKTDARREALARLVRTLQPGGALVVGGTETVSHPLLVPWPKTPIEARIYQRVPA